MVVGGWLGRKPCKFFERSKSSCNELINFCFTNGRCTGCSQVNILSDELSVHAPDTMLLVSRN